MIRELDGKVDAFGIGGIDLYVQAGGRRYVLRQARKIASAARLTPIVDGTGLKNTLERRVIRQLDGQSGLSFRGKKVLLVSGVDRFGMAEALDEAGADLLLGDLIFVLGVPIPLRSLRSLDLVARVLAPIVCQFPINWIYPTGEKQEANKPKGASYFHWADVIAGDFHFIRRCMPESLPGKTIITNTVTAGDVGFLKQRGVSKLITTTPELKGRSFGTNLMEAALVALAGKHPDQMAPSDYEDLLDRIGFKPRMVNLEEVSA